MSRPNSNSEHSGDSRQAQVEASATDKRVEDTFTRLRSALLEERLSLLDLSGEGAGTDPYNSGTHRALVKAHVWGKRSR